MNLHLELASLIESAFGNDLASPVEQKQDAMIVRLKNGVTLNVRYAARSSTAEADASRQYGRR